MSKNKKVKETNQKSSTSTSVDLSTPKDQLDTLYLILDIFQRAQLEFVLDGHTLMQVKEGKPLEAPITVATNSKNYTRYAKSVLQMFFKNIGEAALLEGESGFEKKIILDNGEENKVVIRLYKGSRFIDNPDKINYAYEQFNIPNPVDEFINNNLVI
jgi:hypothetical protein